MSSPGLISAQRNARIAASPTANASANTKGAYAQLSAAIPFDSYGFWINIWSFTAVTRDMLFDIAIGGAGSEQVVLANVQGLCARVPTPIYVPIFIPAGTRVAARCQCTTGGTVGQVDMHLVAGGPLRGGCFSRATTYGANTVDSGGTSIDPGASAGSKGAYTQITASTSAAIKWLIFTIGNQSDASRQDNYWLFDIAIGGAGSEQIVVPDLEIYSWHLVNQPVPNAYCIPVEIPAGTRIAIRAQSDTADATDRLIDVVLVGVG